MKIYEIKLRHMKEEIDRQVNNNSQKFQYSILNNRTTSKKINKEIEDLYNTINQPFIEHST